MERLPLLLPSMPSADALLPFLRRIDANRQYTNFGPLCLEFEACLAQRLPVRDGGWSVTTMANATLALELALQAMDLAPGARVLLPAITFVASATAVLRRGLVPVIADVDDGAWLLTPAIATAALDGGIAFDAVMPVATFGAAQDAAAWNDFARRTGLPVLVDAAGAFGNQSPGERIDVVYSFHATKAFGAGEGGAIVSASAARVERARRLANFGIDTRVGELVDTGHQREDERVPLRGGARGRGIMSNDGTRPPRAACGVRCVDPARTAASAVAAQGSRHRQFADDGAPALRCGTGGGGARGSRHRHAALVLPAAASPSRTGRAARRRRPAGRHAAGLAPAGPPLYSASTKIAGRAWWPPWPPRCATRRRAHEPH